MTATTDWQPGDPLYIGLGRDHWPAEMFEIVDDHPEECQICFWDGSNHDSMRWSPTSWAPGWRDLPDREGMPTP